MKVAFETDIDRGYQIRGIWGDHENARIEVRHISGSCYTFEYPAYKVFNIAAHSEELIDGIVMREYGSGGGPREL